MGYVQMGSYVSNVNGTTIAAPYVPTGHVQPRQRHPVRATGDLKMPLAARCRQPVMAFEKLRHALPRLAATA